ncbi:MAG: hypothetical protein M1401_10280 [Chloroflexi bacterium]|nr:hypothetical protein [Chloroflexota bacterium]
MAKALVTVEAGICGFVTRIAAEMDEEGMVGVTIESDCQNCRGLARDFPKIDPYGLLRGKAKDNAIFAAVARHPLHQACAVPIGISKAVEVAAALALPRDVHIKIEKVEE